MRDIAVALVVFGLLPFVLKRPFWGILLLAWLGYMNPHRLCYGFMLSFPVVYVVALTTMIGMLVSKEAKRIVWSREMTVLVLLVVWMGLTTTQAMYSAEAWVQYQKVLKIQLLTMMTLVMLTSREKVHAFVWVIVLSLGFYGTKGGIFTIAKGGEQRVWGPEGTFIGGNNELALALVMTIPLMRYLQLHSKRRLVRLGLGAAMFLSAVSAIGSQSRGALLALSVMGLLFWLKGRRKLLIGVLTIAAAAVILALMPDAWYERMATIETYQDDASAQGRINAWWTAWNLAKDRFMGGGFEVFKGPTFRIYAPNPEDVHDVHSIYFEMMGEHGFLGLALFLGLLWLAWLKCSTVIKMGRKDPSKAWAGDLAAMIQVSLAGFMVGGAFLGLAYFDYPYHLIALVVVTHALARGDPKSAGAPAPAAPPRPAPQRPAAASLPAPRLARGPK
ncbi:putative O-glycosylation ligase, exosortase A system-associated [Rubrivivax gelatinosus]|uniref:O-glycosylation ligase, exosortase A system-associated n=1 Tax=Rubrivivax gelatinosus TaxID=28068 RepID=A0ABS1DY08_RUBGE|nr:putative O-glycosylation ligase, exosortase A system-associated [Rubrivivax gelatinosus]MBK1714393.1 putative O-glycosylation ligase, exosortase A system-associated [Rubrivivax gelatinosus]